MASTQTEKSKTDVPAHIFREYDIRGIVDKDLTDDVYYNLGRAYGTFLYAQKGIKPVEGERFRVVCGYDARLTGPRFQKEAMTGNRPARFAVWALSSGQRLVQARSMSSAVT